MESGGSKEAFLTDPFQVNKPGDWVPEKVRFGLREKQAPGPALGARAALAWLDMKAHKVILNQDGTKTVHYRGMKGALVRYNANPKLDKNGVAHKYNYASKIMQLSLL